jgi:hypothetical protein
VVQGAVATNRNRSRRRLGAGIVGCVLAVCLLVVVVALLVEPSEAEGYGPDARTQVIGFCKRSAPNVDAVGNGSDDPDAACGCAYDELAQTVPWDRFVEMDESLRSGGDPPPELDAALRACGAVPAG